MLKNTREYKLKNFDIAISESDIIVILVKHKEFKNNKTP